MSCSKKEGGVFVNGNHLKKARERAKMRQEDLAVKLKTTQNTVWRWESGLSDPSDQKKFEIAKILNTTVSFLMGETEEMDVTEDSFDALIKEFGKEDPELVAMFRSTSKDWSGLSAQDKQVLIDGLRFVLGHANAGKYLEKIPEDF